MTLELNLRAVPPELHDQAREAFSNGDGRAFAYIAIGNKLQVVVANLRALKERGIYEQSLLAAFTGCKVNHHGWSEDWMDFMFGYANPILLRAAGGPLPGRGPIVLYRGISGTGRARRLRGYSWTGSLDVACWFAVRFPWLAAPAVLKATVPAEDILAYVKDRGEQEFIHKPPVSVRIRMTRDEIVERAERHTKFVGEARRTRLVEFLAGTRRS